MKMIEIKVFRECDMWVAKARHPDVVSQGADIMTTLHRLGLALGVELEEIKVK